MSDTIDRLNAALEGRYAVERELGEGGMATVFLADDLRHERKVALKVLKPELAAVVGAERFLAEIKTTANLQHPHILALFDSGEADGFLFYVMPYVEGETLKARIDREKQLAVAEAISLTRKVADALDYAHERGVVHRDIKPGNILLSDRGEPIVADFGIALAVAQAGAGRITETGLSLGTPHYMSPEQATGDRDVDPRSDVYALGCVLYEMLAGQPPFMASTAQAILVQILTTEPPSITATRRTVPVHVGHALACALEKLPADRFTTAKAFADALADESYTHEVRARAAAAPAPVPGSIAARVGGEGSWISDWRTRALAGFAAVATAVAALVTLARPEAPRLVQRFAIDMQDLRADGRHEVIISPDGRRLAVTDRDENFRPNLYWREIGEERFQLLVEDGLYPTFSPDGEWLAYVDGQNGPLVRISLSGGAPRPIVPNPPTQVQTPSWSAEGTLVYSADGLWAVPGTGGEPEPLMEAGGWAVNPRLLPGGGALIYTDRRDQGTYLLDLGGDSARLLLQPAIDAQYVATGHLLFADGEGGLWAQGFDVDRLELIGDAVPILTGVGGSPGGWAKYSVSDDGTLVYGLGSVSGGFQLAPDERLMIVDLQGDGRILDLDPRDIAPLRWAPDGETIAFESQGPSSARARSQIFTYNTVLGDIPRPLTFEGENENPVWSPDGTRVVFDRTADGTEGEDLFVKTFGDDAPPVGIVRLPGDQQARDWPTDDLVLFETQGAAGWDLWVYDFAADSAYPYLEAEGDQFGPVLSPDGSLLAYSEFDQGTGTVYVRSFPVARQPELVYRGPRAGNARWSPDGNTLYFWVAGNSDRLLLAARIRREPSFAVVATDTLTSGVFDRAAWDLHPDGDRFIVAVAAEGAATADAAGAAEPERFVVAVNWFAELLAAVGEGGR